MSDDKFVNALTTEYSNDLLHFLIYSTINRNPDMEFTDEEWEVFSGTKNAFTTVIRNIFASISNTINKASEESEKIYRRQKDLARIIETLGYPVSTEWNKKFSTIYNAKNSTTDKNIPEYVDVLGIKFPTICTYKYPASINRVTDIPEETLKEIEEGKDYNICQEEYDSYREYYLEKKSEIEKELKRYNPKGLAKLLHKTDLEKYESAKTFLQTIEEQMQSIQAKYDKFANLTPAEKMLFVEFFRNSHCLQKNNNIIAKNLNNYESIKNYYINTDGKYDKSLDYKTHCSNMEKSATTQFRKHLGNNTETYNSAMTKFCEYVIDHKEIFTDLTEKKLSLKPTDAYTNNADTFIYKVEFDENGNPSIVQDELSNPRRYASKYLHNIKPYEKNYVNNPKIFTTEELADYEYDEKYGIKVTNEEIENHLKKQIEFLESETIGKLEAGFEKSRFVNANNPELYEPLYKFKLKTARISKLIYTHNSNCTNNEKDDRLKNLLKQEEELKNCNNTEEHKNKLLQEHRETIREYILYRKSRAKEATLNYLIRDRLMEYYYNDPDIIKGLEIIKYLKTLQSINDIESTPKCDQFTEDYFAFKHAVKGIKQLAMNNAPQNEEDNPSLT